MATKCPNCGHKLTILDWRQNCPECDTNLMFHGFEERFFEDAKNAELGSAKVRVWWSRVLSNLFGGKLQIIRLIFILLPIAALLLPIGVLHIQLPLYSSDISLGLIGVISSFTDGTVKLVFSLMQDSLTGVVVSALASALISLFGVLACGVLIIVFEILCFLKSRLMSVLLCASSVLGACFAFYGIFAVKQLGEAANGFESLFSVTGGFGSYVLIAAFIAVFVPNVILVKKGVDVKYKAGDLYRLDVAKKLKRGEIKLADLPQPIFETPEERIAREKAIEDTVNGVSPENDNNKEEAKA